MLLTGFDVPVEQVMYLDAPLEEHTLLQAIARRRSARRKKTVAVTVDPTGGVLLVAPEHFATSRLDAVVRRKAAWIVQRLRRVQSHDPPLSPREFVTGTIRLNWRIIQAPMRWVDYVVVHELVHLRHRGHGRTTGRPSAA